jgi:hypothetical protein
MNGVSQFTTFPPLDEARQTFLRAFAAWLEIAPPNLATMEARATIRAIEGLVGLKASKP